MSTLEDHPWNDKQTRSTSPFAQGGVIIGKHHYVERAKASVDEKVLYQTAAMVRADMNSTPENHVAPFDLRAALVRSKTRTAIALGKSTAMTTMVTIATTIASMPTIFAGHEVGAIVTIALVAMTTWVMTTIWMVRLGFVERDRLCVEAYATIAPRFVMEMLEHRLEGDEIVRVSAFMVGLYENMSKDHADARRKAVSTISAIRHAYVAAVAAIGNGDRSDVDRDTAVALLNTIDVARREIVEIDRQVLERDSRNAVPVSREFSAKMAELTSGVSLTAATTGTTTTGNAKVDFIARSIRKALEMNPDMVDANGARIDALIERILPDLLERHAEASRHARVEDLKSINDDLDEGIELIRVPLDEGLAGLRTRSAERLRTQIDFLKLRRGVDHMGLTSVDNTAGTASQNMRTST